jgi:hypothetical protein
MLGGEHRVKSDLPAVASRKTDALEWIDDVLDTRWLPPKSARVICLRKEFEDRDTIRVAWNHCGFHLEASQTFSAMALRITPSCKAGTGNNLAKRVGYARELAKKLFNDKAYMLALDGQMGPRIPIDRVKERIVSFSFLPDKTRQLPRDKVVMGFEKSIEDNGFFPAFAYIEDEQSKDPVKGTAQATWYWFRNIRWWNDGKSVGFYFLKLNGPGPVVISYCGMGDFGADRDWFEEPEQ